MSRLPHFGMSLRTRLTLWYGVLLATTLLGFSLLLYFTLQESLARSVDDRLSLRADQVGRVLGPNVGNLLQPEDVPPPQVDAKPLDAFVAPGIYVQVVNVNGAVIAAPPNLFGGDLPVTDDTHRAIETDQPVFARVSVFAAGANVRVLTVPVHGSRGEVAGAVQVAESLSPLENTMSAVARLLSLAGAGALLLAVVLGWLFTRSALSPVARITALARHIATTGDYRQRLGLQPPPLGRGDDLFFLAATFDDMIARLEQVVESQRRLLADTSHELRNPLTVVRGNLALLRRGGLPAEDHRQSIMEAESEAARMSRLVDDLLLLARADAGDLPRPGDDRVDLTAVAGQVVERARASAGGRTLTLSAPAPVIVLGDPDRLKQLVTNLVENALRYTPASGQVHVHVGVTQERAGMAVQRGPSSDRSPISTGLPRMDTAHLTVADTGIGIAPAELAYVFERFYRVDRARTRAHGGVGLGLSIAQYVAQAHGGRIEATSAGVNRGSAFHVFLPLAEDARAPVRHADARHTRQLQRAARGQV